MDRFIGIQLLNFRYIDADLKSNMDRFIECDVCDTDRTKGI